MGLPVQHDQVEDGGQTLDADVTLRADAGVDEAGVHAQAGAPADEIARHVGHVGGERHLAAVFVFAQCRRLREFEVAVRVEGGLAFVEGPAGGTEIRSVGVVVVIGEGKIRVRRGRPKVRGRSGEEPVHVRVADESARVVSRIHGQVVFVARENVGYAGGRRHLEFGLAIFGHAEGAPGERDFIALREFDADAVRAKRDILAEVEGVCKRAGRVEGQFLFVDGLALEVNRDVDRILLRQAVVQVIVLADDALEEHILIGTVDRALGIDEREGRVDGRPVILLDTEVAHRDAAAPELRGEGEMVFVVGAREVGMRQSVGVGQAVFVGGGFADFLPVRIIEKHVHIFDGLARFEVGQPDEGFAFGGLEGQVVAGDDNGRGLQEIGI